MYFYCLLKNEKDLIDFSFQSAHLHESVFPGVVIE